MSHSIYHYQSVSLSTFKVSVFTFLTHTANIPILYTAIPQHIISPTHWLDIWHFWNPSRSLVVRCTAKEVTLGFLIIPVGVEAQFSVNSDSLYSCLSVCSPWHLAPAVVRSSSKYGHNACVHAITSNLRFYFWCSLCLKCIQDQHSLFSQEYPWPYVPYH